MYAFIVIILLNNSLHRQFTSFTLRQLSKSERNSLIKVRFHQVIVNMTLIIGSRAVLAIALIILGISALVAATGMQYNVNLLAN